MSHAVPVPIPRATATRQARVLGRALLLAMAVVLATTLSTAPMAEATPWLANGVILGFMLTARGRHRAWEQGGLLLLGLAVSFATLVAGGLGTSLVACHLVADLTQLVLASALLRDRLGGRPDLGRPRHLLAFALIGPGLACLASATCLGLLLGWGRPGDWVDCWIGNALGLAVSTPLVLMLATARHDRCVVTRSHAEAALLLGLGGASMALACFQPDTSLLTLPFAAAMLLVCRLGAPGAAWLLPIATLIASFGGAALHPATTLQTAVPLYLAPLAVTLLPLGALLSQYRRRARVMSRRAAGRRRETERLRQSEQLYRLLADNSSDIISRFDLNAIRSYVSPSVVGILGWSVDEMLRAEYQRHIHPEDLERFIAVGEEMQRGRERISNVYRYRRLDGSWAWLEARLILLRDPDGKPREIISNTRDITRQKEAEIALAAAAAELTELAATDSLTGVANRRRFDEMLDREWRRAMRSHDHLSLLLIDVDHFKRFNDRYGHLMGDTCLHAIATAIAGSVRRPGDLVARYGGEEFAVILPSTDGEGAMEIASRVRAGIAALAMPHIDNPGAFVTVSIGCAEAIPDRTTDSSLLVEAADKALYDAKRLGRGRSERAPMLGQAEVAAMPENVIRLPVARAPLAHRR